MIESLRLESFAVLLLPIILAVIGIMIRESFIKLNDLTSNNKMFNKALLAVNECAKTVVRSLNQQIVDDLKKKSKDGKLTNAEAKEILLRACEKIDNLLTDEVKETIMEIYGDYEEYLRLSIERAVSEAKTDKINNLLKEFLKKMDKPKK